MRRFTTWVLVAALLSLMAVACQAPANKENAEGTENSKAEQKDEQTIPTTPAKVLNANLATEADMKGMGLSADLIAQVLDKRPFVTMNELDALVGDEANKEELYKKVFVPFNLNTTAEDDFKMIPGVGDRMAHEFEEYRPYTSIQQFRKEIGKYVDAEVVAGYEDYVFVPVELNSATEADIKALPGVGDRMAHEFEEYRPYKNMEQFRKEIGKYVDDKELERLARFVYIK
ncbi:MAG: helix-hairpin-helix domain-containing protein [Bacteroidota bacterium]